MSDSIEFRIPGWLFIPLALFNLYLWAVGLVSFIRWVVR